MNARQIARGLIVVAAVVLAVARFVAIDASSHSASDTLRPWGIELVAIAAAAMLLSRATDTALRRVRR